MGAVARSAFAVFDGLVFDLGLGKLLLNVLMTLGAQLPVRFDQQLLVVRLVGIVAREALTVFRRLMFDLGFGELRLHILVAFETQFAIRLEQKLFVI